jgi:hypothetical protein
MTLPTLSRMAMVVASCFLASSTLADESPQVFFGVDPLLATVSKVSVDVSDDVKGGCFTNQVSLKTTVELTLRQQGMIVDDDAVDTIFVSALGNRDRTVAGRDLGCSISVEMELLMHRGVYVPYADGRMTVTSVTYWVGQTLITGPGNLDSGMKSFAVEKTEKLVNEILRARQEFFAKNPSVKARIDAAQ